MKDYRLLHWRKWAAKELMAQPERNRRVMVALARAGDTGNVRKIEFGQAVRKIAGPAALQSTDFTGALFQTNAIDVQHLDTVMLAVTAAAAFGVGLGSLEALLNFLEVDERRHFTWDAEFMELFTLSELESLAGEVGLKAKMGSSFKLARARKKADFIKALLAVPGFAYVGTVPAVMRYPRRTAPAESLAPMDEEHAAAPVEAAEEEALAG